MPKYSENRGKKLPENPGIGTKSEDFTQQLVSKVEDLSQ